MNDTSAANGGGDTAGEPHDPPASEHDRQIEEFLFKRELDQVYLLLDFISGRPDKDLSKLKVPDPVPAVDQDADHELPPRKVIERLAAIRYPPMETPTRNADNAALLMLAKDRLTALASPARGITIAYTVLFTETPWLRALRRLLSPGSPRPAAPDEPVGRYVLAEGAFPGLSAEVHRFIQVLVLLLIVAILWLILTAFAYWDVALGRSIMQRIDHVHEERNALFQANPKFTLAPDSTPAAAPAANAAANAAAKPEPYHAPPICAAPRPEDALSCWKFQTLAHVEDEAKQDLKALRDCGGSTCVHIHHVLRWAFVLCGATDGNMEEEQSFVSVLSVFSNYILPMMFGVLGTFMSAIRNIQWKVRESTLSPRDLWNTVLALPLGIVAGVAVGLFYSPSTAPPVTGGGGLAANLTLTTCGLGFLAGYGSQAFFDALDALLKTVFTFNGDASKPKPAA